MNFYLRILLILLISCIVLSLFNKAYLKGHSTYYQHETERLSMLLNSNTDYDVLYIGSSRTHVHYNPQVIDNITHLHSYNLGVEGGNLLETNLWLQLYLQKHKRPKLVLLDLPIFAFDIERRPFFNHTIYFPYLDNDIIYNTLGKYKKIGLYKYLPFLELMEADDYNKFNALKGILGKKDEMSSGITYNGYAANGKDILKPGDYILRDTIIYNLSETGKKIFNDVIETCKKGNIKLMITYSPEYYDTHHSKENDFFNYIKQITADNNISFYDYRTLNICKDSLLFANRGHLNMFGADIFSKDVAVNIIHELSKN